jgi:hypothetical protein
MIHNNEIGQIVMPPSYIYIVVSYLGDKDQKHKKICGAESRDDKNNKTYQ